MAKDSARMSAEERRESAVRAAVIEFGRGGYFGTSTERIARRVGVSQPYLFRLFDGKAGLFRAAAAYCFDTMIAALEEAAGDAQGAEALSAMGEAYDKLIVDRDILLMQMQLYVAVAGSDDSELAEYVRRRWGDVWSAVASRTGATDRQLNVFFGSGMLINVLVALGIPSDDRSWAGFGIVGQE